MKKESISEIIKEAEVLLNIEKENKEEILKELVESFPLTEEQKEMLFQSVTQREKMGSTGIGNGIAIPHTRSMVVRELKVAIARPVKPVEYDSVDGKPVRLIFLLVAPPYTNRNEYLILLGKIAEAFEKISKDKELFTTEDVEEFRDVLCNELGCNDG